MISIIIAEDQHIVRTGLKALLESEKNIKIIGEAANGLEAIKLAEKFHPNVSILDVAMPGINGLEAARQIRQSCSNTRILLLSMYSDEGYVEEAIKSGADGYILKDETASTLVEAINCVYNGEHYFSPQISSIINEIKNSGKSNHVDPYNTLTIREKQILKLVAEGNTNTEISDLLFISKRTAETHRANMMKKLNLRNQSEVVRFAIHHNIISPAI